MPLLVVSRRNHGAAVVVVSAAMLLALGFLPLLLLFVACAWLFGYPPSAWMGWLCFGGFVGSVASLASAFLFAREP